jgi:addiction module HigA family antidote
MPNHLDPVTPGEILFEEFMQPHGIGRNRLARDIDVPVSRIADVVNGRRVMSTDTALRFAAAFGTSEKFWLNLQMEYDLRRLRRAGAAERTMNIRKHELAPSMEQET